MHGRFYGYGRLGRMDTRYLPRSRLSTNREPGVRARTVHTGGIEPGRTPCKAIVREMPSFLEFSYSVVVHGGPWECNTTDGHSEPASFRQRDE